MTFRMMKDGSIDERLRGKDGEERCWKRGGYGNKRKMVRKKTQ